MADDTSGRDIRHYQSDEFKYYLQELPGLGGIKLPIIELPDTDDTGTRFYWPIAAICEDVLHINAQRQIQRLRLNSATAPLMREFKVKTGQGMRRAVFLAYDGLGAWLQSINLNNMAEDADVRRVLPLFQQAAIRVVNALATGRIAPIAPELAGPPSEKLTLKSGYDYTAFVERRVDGQGERIAALERLLHADGGYVRDYDATGDDAGIITLPFTCEHGVRYLIRLRWPEVVAIVRDPEQ